MNRTLKRMEKGLNSSLFPATSPVKQTHIQTGFKITWNTIRLSYESFTILIKFYDSAIHIAWLQKQLLLVRPEPNRFFFLLFLISIQISLGGRFFFCPQLCSYNYDLLTANAKFPSLSSLVTTEQSRKVKQ